MSGVWNWRVLQTIVKLGKRQINNLIRIKNNNNNNNNKSVQKRREGKLTILWNHLAQ
jgi:hypothetical protein